MCQTRRNLTLCALKARIAATRTMDLLFCGSRTWHSEQCMSSSCDQIMTFSSVTCCCQASDGHDGSSHVQQIAMSSCVLCDIQVLCHNFVSNSCVAEGADVDAQIFVAQTDMTSSAVREVRMQIALCYS